MRGASRWRFSIATLAPLEYGQKYHVDAGDRIGRQEVKTPMLKRGALHASSVFLLAFTLLTPGLVAAQPAATAPSASKASRVQTPAQFACV